MAYLEEKFNDWTDNYKKEVTKGFQKTGRELKREVQARAKGSIKKSIKSKIKNYSGGVKTLKIGSNAPHAHLLEKGTVDRYNVNYRKKPLKNRKHTGRMPKMPFLEPVLRSKGKSLLIKNIEEAILKATR